MGEVIYFRHRARYKPSDTPFSQMNITPLIDVMLVLLVMLILAVPAAMHQTSAAGKAAHIGRGRRRTAYRNRWLCAL